MHAQEQHLTVWAGSHHCTTRLQGEPQPPHRKIIASPCSWPSRAPSTDPANTQLHTHPPTHPPVKHRHHVLVDGVLAHRRIQRQAAQQLLTGQHAITCTPRTSSNSTSSSSLDALLWLQQAERIHHGLMQELGVVPPCMRLHNGYVEQGRRHDTNSADSAPHASADTAHTSADAALAAAGGGAAPFRSNRRMVKSTRPSSRRGRFSSALMSRIIRAMSSLHTCMWL